MTPEQFAAALAKAELSQVGAARFLTLNERTARRMAAGDTEIPGAVDKLLRLMLALKMTAAEVDAAIKKVRL